MRPMRKVFLAVALSVLPIGGLAVYGVGVLYDRAAQIYQG